MPVKNIKACNGPNFAKEPSLIGTNMTARINSLRDCIVYFWDMFYFSARIDHNGMRTASRGGRDPIPRPPN